MIPALLLLALSAPPQAMVPVNAVRSALPDVPLFSGRFTEGGFRSEESTNGKDAKSFAELARLAFTAKGDGRVMAAQRAFDAFARYTAPVNVQFPRCHCGRTYEGLRAYDVRRQLVQPPNSLTQQETRDFKKACYAMLKSPDPWTQQRAAEHLVIVADHDDLATLLGMLRGGNCDRGMICLALGRIGDEEAIPALAKELSGKDWERAAAALENIGGEKARAALGKAAAVVRGK